MQIDEGTLGAQLFGGLSPNELKWRARAQDALMGGETPRISEKAQAAWEMVDGGFRKSGGADTSKPFTNEGDGGNVGNTIDIVFEDVRFAQKTYSGKFSPEGQKLYSELAGEPITTVDDLSDALAHGTIDVSDISIDYIVRDGNVLILNTRSSQALIQAGIPMDQWNFVNKTGDPLFEEMLTNQLENNGLTSEGTKNVKRSGGQKNGN